MRGARFAAIGMLLALAVGAWGPRMRSLGTLVPTNVPTVVAATATVNTSRAGAVPATSSTGAMASPTPVASRTRSSSKTGVADQIPSTGTGATDEAPTYGIDGGRTFSQPADSTAPPLTRLWSVDLGARIWYPLIAAGRVFIATVHLDGSPGSLVYALNAADGSIAWGPVDIGGSNSLSRPYPPGLTYDAGKLFAFNYDSVGTAFEAANGRVLWQRSYTSYPLSFGDYPYAADGVVYAGVGLSTAINEATGEPIWSSNNGWVSAFASDALYTSDSRINPVDGAQVWAGKPLGRASVYRGRVYHSGGSNVTVDAATGRPVGSLAGTDSRPAFGGSFAFTFSPDSIAAEDVNSNLLAWTFPGNGKLATQTLYANGYVYTGSSDGNLYALNAQTGALVWSDNVGSFAAGATLVAAEHVLLAPAGTRLVAYHGSGPARPSPTLPTVTAANAEPIPSSAETRGYQFGSDLSGAHLSEEIAPPLAKKWRFRIGTIQLHPLVVDHTVVGLSRDWGNHHGNALLYALDASYRCSQMRSSGWRRFQPRVLGFL